MPKIKMIKPLVGTLKPLIGRSPGDEKARYHERDENQPWRAWYYSRRWKELRKAVWVRDAYTCRKTGTLCIGRYPAGDSPVADHIIPHRGDPDLFWDINNVQTVSKEYHDSEKQGQERAGRW